MFGPQTYYRSCKELTADQGSPKMSPGKVRAESGQQERMSTTCESSIVSSTSATLRFSGLPVWNASVEATRGTGETSGSVWDDGQTDSSGFDARTDTVMGYDHELEGLSEVHSKDIRHYKHLLVQAQNSYASQIHSLHTRLRATEAKLEQLRSSTSAVESYLTPPTTEVDFGTIWTPSAGLPRQTDGRLDDDAISRDVRSLNATERLVLLKVVCEACTSFDLDAQIAYLRKLKRSTFDVVGALPDHIAVQVLQQLKPHDILNIRLVSKTYNRISRQPAIWRSLCLSKAAFDPVQPKPRGESPGSWEDLYKGLHHRETNWARGLSQTVELLQGHSHFVTSLQLRGDVLLSGSYDETIRIWDLPSRTCRMVLRAKAVSCLDFFPEGKVFAVGFHDTGRVQLWSSETWQVIHTLSGHLHGIRAITLNDRYLVSAGADKALVCWNWRTGEKIYKFGQQTAVCVGVQLLGGCFVAVTIEGDIRCFSIETCELLSQHRISDLAWNDQPINRLRTINGKAGGTLTWFSAQERFMTCATKDTIVHFEWEISMQSDAPVIITPTTPVRKVRPQKSGLSVTATLPSTLPSSPSASFFKSATLASVETSSRTGKKNDTPVNYKMHSPSLRKRASMSQTPPLTPTTKGRRSILSRSVSNNVPAAAQTGPVVSPSPAQIARADLRKPPRVIEVMATPEVEKGAVDAAKRRAVTSTRFALRAGAERQIYLSTPIEAPVQTTDERPQSLCVPIAGAWAAACIKHGLLTPEKNPMSIAIDHERVAYGCTDGTICLIGFVGHSHQSQRPFEAMSPGANEGKAARSDL